MTTNQTAVIQTDSGIDEVSFAGTTHIETPIYSPEVKSDEDLTVLLRNGLALDDGSPILVPGYTWHSIRSRTKFQTLTSQIQDLVRNHPILYREPVELFRFRRPRRLVSYGLGADRGRSGRFYKHLRGHRFDKAIGMLPEFIQPFVEVQMERLLELEDVDVPSEYKNTLQSTTNGWNDKRANQGWPNYFADIAKDAKKSPNAGVVPPVPPIRASSNQSVIDQAMGANHGMVNTCRKINAGRFGSPIYPYLHIYTDYSVLKDTTNNDFRIVDAIRQEIRDRDEESSLTEVGDGGVSYQGVVLTITNLSNVWESNMVVRLEQFVEQIETAAREYGLPVMMPRSGWYGLYLTDLGIQNFSSLLNGNETYSQRGRGGITTEAKFGKTPFYGTAIEPSAPDTYRMLKNTGGTVHPVAGLPNEPPTFDPSASNWENRLGDPEQYRKEFGKPRRLVHAQEAREIRASKTKGRNRPAKQYLQNSEHNDFS